MKLVRGAPAGVFADSVEFKTVFRNSQVKDSLVGVVYTELLQPIVVVGVAETWGGDSTAASDGVA